MIFFISASIAGKSSSESGSVEIEVVVETAFHGGPEGQLDPFEQPHHGPGHHVRAGVPHHGQRFRVLLGQQPQCDLAVGGQLVVEADDRLVDLGRHGGFGQTGANFRSNVAGSYRIVRTACGFRRGG